MRILLAGLLVLGLAFLGAPIESTDWYVPEDDVTGTLSNAKFIATGRKYAGDFCNGSRSGKMQGMTAVYTGSDPAANTQFVKDSTGVNPGTRMHTLTKDSIKDCTDNDLGDIFKYSGTEE